jgi:hypothetical protein
MKYKQSKREHMQPNIKKEALTGWRYYRKIKTEKNEVKNPVPGDPLMVETTGGVISILLSGGHSQQHFLVSGSNNRWRC